jgi:diguanylate cyclase
MMAVPHDEHERTFAFADVALGQIRALGQPVSPRNFEIWYNYATGYNAELNKSINDTLAKNGALSEADLDQIYNTFIGTTRAGERIDSVGSRVLDEIRQVLDMVDAAAGSATNYSESLADASQQLERAKDGEALRTVIAALVEGAKDMEGNNKKLEARLSASRQEIEQLQQNLEAVRTESLTDPLTTLSNRKFFDAALAKGIAEAKEKKRAVIAADGRHRSFQEFQRSVRASHGRSGAAAGRHLRETERQGPRHCRALRRRGIRHRAAEHGAATGDHGG